MSLAPRIKWNVNEASIARIAKAYKNRSLKDVKEAIGFAAKAGEKGTLDFKVVGTSKTDERSGTPTGSTWHRFANYVRGNNMGARVDSGRMAASVGSSNPRGSKGLYNATYGLPLNGPKYFFQQENGFTFETWSGRSRKVPGMSDKRYGAQKKIDDAIKKELRKKMVSRGFASSSNRADDERIIARMGRGMDFDDAWSMRYPGNPNYMEFLKEQQLRAMQKEIVNELRFTAFMENIERMEGFHSAQAYYNKLKRSQDR